jgi:tricorn protease
MAKSVRFLISPTLALTVTLILGFAAPGVADQGPGAPLLRFPDVSGDTVVFVHAEDIWTASTSGGIARRLTDDEGEERHPKLSPAGTMVAFTAEIDGNPDVYVMNVDGSDIRRLTYHPGRDEVVGWHPESTKILFRSGRASGPR